MGNNEAQQFYFFAFISHKDDEGNYGNKLQEDLEHSRIPEEVKAKNPELSEWIRPIFLDDTDISGNDLDKAIKEALEDSQFLIVVCSPLAAKSSWVEKEIRYFIELGRKDKIIPFIIDGKPFSEDPTQECYSKPLLELKEREGLNLRGPDIRKAGWEKSVVSVISTMFGVPFDSLWQRIHREERRKRQKRIVSLIILLVTVALMVLPIILFYRHRGKEMQLHKAVVEANALMDANRDYEAGEILVDILKQRPHSVPLEAEWALYRLLKTQGGFLAGEFNVKDMFDAGNGYIRSLTISKGNRKAFLQEWNLLNGRRKTLADYEFSNKYYGSFNVFFGKNGEIVVTDDGLILDGNSLKPIGELDNLQPNRILNHVSVSPDGSRIAGVLGDSIAIWKDYSLVYSTPVFQEGIHSTIPIKLRFSPDGRVLAADSGHSLVIIQVDEDTVSRYIPPDEENWYKSAVSSAQSSASKKEVNDSSERGSNSGRIIRDFNPLVFSPDGHSVMSITRRTSVIYDFSQGEIRVKKVFPVQAISGEYSSDGASILTVTSPQRGRKVEVRDSSGNSLLWSEHYDSRMDNAIFAANDTLVVIAFENGLLLVRGFHSGWHPKGLRVTSRDQHLYGPASLPSGYDCMTSADDKRSIKIDKTSHYYVEEDGVAVGDWTFYQPESKAVCLSPDGKMVFVVKKNGDKILGWKLNHPDKPFLDINIDNHAPSYISVSPDGKILLGVASQMLKLWEIKTGYHLINLDYSNKCRISRAAFTYDSKEIRTAYDVYPDIWSWEIPDKKSAISSFLSRYSKDQGE